MDFFCAGIAVQHQGKKLKGIRSCPTEPDRSEEHTSELQSRPHISYAVFCLKKKKKKTKKQKKKRKKKKKKIEQSTTV